MEDHLFIRCTYEFRQSGYGSQDNTLNRMFRHREIDVVCGNILKSQRRLDDFCSLVRETQRAFRQNDLLKVLFLSEAIRYLAVMRAHHQKIIKRVGMLSIDDYHDGDAERDGYEVIPRWGEDIKGGVVVSVTSSSNASWIEGADDF